MNVMQRARESACVTVKSHAEAARAARAGGHSDILVFFTPAFCVFIYL